MATARSPLIIEEMSPGDDATAAMGGLIAARQRSVWRTAPGISRRYCDPDEAAALVAGLDSGDGWFGAWRHGRLVAFLRGTSNGRFGLAPSTSHAISSEEDDPTAVYGALYAALATRWLDAGVFVHDVEMPALGTTEAAWFDLGFGRRTCYAARTTETDLHAPPDVDVRVATDDELARVVALVLHEAEVRAAPPLFADQGRLDAAVFEALHREVVHDGGLHLIGSADGADVGVLTIEARSPAPLLSADGAPFIGPTAVDPGARGRGVGRALAAAALRWARSRGHESMSVAFNPPNLISRPFWRGCGFVATGWKLARRLPQPPGA